MALASELRDPVDERRGRPRGFKIDAYPVEKHQILTVGDGALA